MRRRRDLITLAALGCLACFCIPQGVLGQETCPAGKVGSGAVVFYLQNAISKAAASNLASSQERRMAPDAEKIGAPSTSSGSTSLVDSPAFTEALQLAWESGLVSSSNGVLTIDLNLFAFRAASNQWLEMDQWLYDAPGSRKLRRFGGAVSFGGEGEKFDRDGDGKEDEPIQAEELGDIVTYELRYRIFGSRDRREKPNYDKYFNSPAAEAFRQAYQPPGEPGDLERAALDLQNVLNAEGLIEDGCISTKEIDKRFELHRAPVVEAIEMAEEDVDALLKTIDKSPILTLAVGGVARETDFGTDERYAALRFAWASLEAELLYKEKDAFSPDDPDPTTLKLGVKHSWYVLEGVLGDAKTQVSLEGSYEHFEDVPDAKHDTVSKVGIKTEYQLSETMKIPISVTWANHEDLLSDDDEIRGHIGLSFDVGNLLAKQKS